MLKKPPLGKKGRQRHRDRAVVGEGLALSRFSFCVTYLVGWGSFRRSVGPAWRQLRCCRVRSSRASSLSPALSFMLYVLRSRPSSELSRR